MNKLLLVLIIPVLNACSGGDNSFKEEPQVITYVPKEVVKQLQEGDFILRQGGGAFSEKIIEFMGEEKHFSHIGLVAKIDGKLQIIHSVSEELSGRDGVQTQSIALFISDVGDSNICVVRPKFDSTQVQQVIAQAKYYLQQEVTFDYDYNTDDSSKLYCIELMYYAVKPIIGKENFTFKTSSDGTYIPLFGSFLNPDFFETIYCLKP